ncbi:C40 family peptidase [Rhodococcus qingshengii]|uniref:C40 family peptidase n=1 Tax=Rhodococcus qingshengii TaxID=334542 RepID=UPI0037CCB103
MSLLQPTIAPLHIAPPDQVPAVPFESPAPVVSQFNADPIEQAPLPLTAPTHGQQALAAAESKLGAPYVWGETGPDSFDCSGLAQWAYMQAGVSIPRTTYDQAVGGVPVSEQDLEPGDLVLFYGGEHVGLYAGNGEVVHAPTSGQSVKRAPLDSMPFYRARRY